MDYTEILVKTTTDDAKDTLIALLNDIGFDGFDETIDDSSFKAFISTSNFNQEAFEQVIEPFNISFEIKEIPSTNWNAVWESNFSPISIEKDLYIRANFHEPVADYKHEIVITPKMSFGTGHHATTYMCLQLMQQLNFSNQKVYDFGSGTGILAIHAEQLGASYVLAVDNDDWCINNSIENVEANNCKHIFIQKVEDAAVQEKFDTVIANVNRHIIIDNFTFICEAVKASGHLIVSGILQENEHEIVNLFTTVNFELIDKKNKDQGIWIALLFKLK